MSANGRAAQLNDDKYSTPSSKSRTAAANGSSSIVSNSETKTKGEVNYSNIKLGSDSTLSTSPLPNQAAISHAVSFSSVMKCTGDTNDDKKEMIKKVKQDGFALMVASSRLQNDKDLVIAAVAQNGRCLDYASSTLQKDPDIIRAAVQGGRLDLATEGQKKNRSIVLCAVKKDGSGFKHAAERLQNDREIAKAAITQDPHVLEIVPILFKDDKELVMLAVRQDGSTLVYASETLRNDREVVMAAITQDGLILNDVSHTFQNDKEIVMIAVAQDANSLEHASKSLQRDTEVVLSAVKNDGAERTVYYDDEVWIVDTRMVQTVELHAAQAEEARAAAKNWSWGKFQRHLNRVRGSQSIPDPVYEAKTCLCLTPKNPLRSVAITIAHHKFFESFILTLIIINCCFMLIGSPYAPCCRAGETLTEGGPLVSSWSEMQAGCTHDGSTLESAVKEFDSFLERNLTECIKAAEAAGTKWAVGEGKCDSTGTSLWRDVKNKNDAFPAHPPMTTVDFNWPWMSTTTKCCVPVDWAKTNGIYTAQKPAFYPVDGPPELALQPQLCADTSILDTTQMADYVFTGFFTFEMIVKIVASGFIWTKGNAKKHMPGAYLRDAWNWLDFIVIIAAYLELLNLGSGVLVLRTFRVLRPLRTLNKVPSMKMLVRSLLRSLAPMVYVLMLMMFVLLLWGIVGTQLWSGLLHGTCMYYDPSSSEADSSGFVADPAQDGVLCGLKYVAVQDKSYDLRVTKGSSPLVQLTGESYDVISRMFYEPLQANGMINNSNWENYYDNTTTVARVNDGAGVARTCDDRIFGSSVWSVNKMASVPLVDGIDRTKSIPTMMCRFGENPNFGLSSFDNLGNAVLWIFASITLEGWVDAMYNVNQVWSFKSPFMTFFVEGIYFTMLYLIGSMFMLNLTLAVIWEEFENEAARETKDEDALIEQELLALKTSKGIQVQDREEWELNARRKHRADAIRAAATGDPVPDPWGPPCVRKIWYKLAISKWFSLFITLAILANTITMALEHHDWRLYRNTYDYNKTLNAQNSTLGEALSQPADLTAFLSIANDCFTIIFIVEMVIKTIGLSPPEYWRDNFNKFDFTIVMFSIVETLLTFFGIGSDFAGLSVLRTFRVLRVMKLAKKWKSLQDLLITIANSLLDVTVAAALATLMMFIFTLLGMEFFGGKWNVETFGDIDNVPRANFDSFGDGFMTVFQVLTGENWNDLLWASYKTNGAIGWLYFLALTFVGNYMIFNLFLAILLSKFEEGSEEEEAHANDLKLEAQAAVAKIAAERKERKARQKAMRRSSSSSPSPSSPDLPKVVETKHSTQHDAEEKEPREAQKEEDMKATENSEEYDSDDEERLFPDPVEDQIVCSGTSLLVLSPENSFRQWCFQLAGNKKFDQFILFLIVVSSIFLAMDEPWVSACACYDKNDETTWANACTSEVPLSWVGYFNEGNSMGYYQFLLYSDLIISIFFFFEMMLKIIALGFAFHPHSYLRNGWNALDFGIVCVSLVALATGPLVIGICGVDAADSSLKTLRALRIFRALRPLRVIKRDPGLRMVINSLFQAAVPISTVMLVTLLFMSILGILGQQFFVGAVALCNDADAVSFPDCVGWYNITGGDCAMLPVQTTSTTFTAEEWSTFANPIYTPPFVLDSIDQCEKNGAMGSHFPRIWDSLSVNFDAFGNSLTTVFEVASGEMWPDIMVTTIDARGIGQQPLPRTQPHFTFAWYFLVQFMIAFVMLNVFIGVIIEKYNENKDANEGSGLLTTDQKVWVETMKLALNSKAKKNLYPPENMLAVRMPAYHLVTNAKFDYSIMACILINVVFMGSSHFNQPVIMHDILTVVNIFFNIVFTLEMIVKWIGIGKQYFHDTWNLFDGFLVILSWIAQTGALPPSIAQLFRMFRVARMVRLVRKVTGLLNLFKTLIFSLPALKNVAIIMTLFMFIFSCFAMNTFADVKMGDLLTSDANFQTFFLSFNTMWRLSSGESYNGIMHDLNIRMPYCNPDAGGAVNPLLSNCGSEFWAFGIITISFTVLNYILVNLFIAIILDNFSDQCSMSESKVTPECLETFDEVWALFDAKGTGRVLQTLLPKMLEKIEYPLGLKNVPVEHLHHRSIRKVVSHMIQQLDIISVDGYISFSQTKKALTTAAMDDWDDSSNWDEKINFGGASQSLAMKRIDKQAKKVDSKVILDAERNILKHKGSSMGLVKRFATSEKVIGVISAYYTVAESTAAQLIQATIRGRRTKRKWAEVIRLALEKEKLNVSEWAINQRSGKSSSSSSSSTPREIELSPIKTA